MTDPHLPRVIEVLEVIDCGPGPSASCPHCGADGRYITRFRCDAEVEQVRQALLRYAEWDKVPDETMNELCRGANLIEVKRKRSIFRRGEQGPGLFIVKSGEFKLSLISSEGREQEALTDQLAGLGEIEDLLNDPICLTFTSPTWGSGLRSKALRAPSTYAVASARRVQGRAFSAPSRSPTGRLTS